MGKILRRRQLTGCRCRLPLCQATSCSCSMHLTLATMRAYACILAMHATRSTCAIFNNIASTHSEGVYVVTFPHTYLHILVPTFTGNLNLNFKILSELKEITLTNLPKYSLGLSPRDFTFSHLNRFSKTNHKIVSQTSLCQKPASARFRGRPNCSVASSILIKI
jgi:hypothetical protein